LLGYRKIIFINLENDFLNFFIYFLEIKYYKIDKILKMSDQHGASQAQSPNGDIELKFIDAKAYLQTTSTKSGDNVCVNKIFYII
jgi:hypothetical protein